VGLPTVRTVWRLALPAGTRPLVLSLSGQVTWARRMAFQLPAFSELDRGELVLLSVGDLGVLDERLTLERVVEALAERAAAGLAVIGSVDGGALQAAQELGIAILQLPADCDLRDVEKDVIRLIVERQAQLDRRGRQVYRQLAQLSIEGQGLEAIVHAMSGMTGKLVLVQDASLALLAMDSEAEDSLVGHDVRDALSDPIPLYSWSRGQRLDSRAPAYTELPLGEGGWTRCVAVIVIQDRLGGYLSILSPRERVDDLDRLVVERGALVCAVELSKQRAVQAAEMRLFGDLLDALLTGGPNEQESLERRALERGYDLDGTHAVVLLSLSGHSTGVTDLIAGDLVSYLRSVQATALPCPFGADLAVLCAAPQDPASLDGLLAAVQNVRARVAEISPRTSIAAGIGRPLAGLAGLRRSFAQAQQSLDLARRLFDGDRVLSFGDLGLYHLLCRLQHCEELDEFYQQTLAALAAYDARHNTALIPTLEAFFAHHGNVSQTAESLYLHRNSLLYRLERIAEITGLDLSDADQRFSLQLALKVRPLLGA